MSSKAYLLLCAPQSQLVTSNTEPFLTRHSTEASHNRADGKQYVTSRFPRIVALIVDNYSSGWYFKRNEESSPLRDVEPGVTSNVTAQF